MDDVVTVCLLYIPSSLHHKGVSDSTKQLTKNGHYRQRGMGSIPYYYQHPHTSPVGSNSHVTNYSHVFTNVYRQHHSHQVNIFIFKTYGVSKLSVYINLQRQHHHNHKDIISPFP